MLRSKSQQQLQRFIAAATVFFFVLSPQGLVSAQGIPATAAAVELPAPGTMVSLSQPFQPPLLKGIKVYVDDPFRLDFILDWGDSTKTGRDLTDESNRLIKYFLAALTVAENDLWVNLSPYEKDRIVPEAFGQTEMGYELVAQDYLLKQITASLLHPERDLGRVFWQKVYAQAQEMFGTTDIPIDTFNKVWIVPQDAVIYENARAGAAYVVGSKLKVMLESDYLALRSSNVELGEGSDTTASQDLGKRIIREVIIPALEKEVNEGANFARLRQVYHSLILATWYKKKIRESLLSQVYVDQDKVFGVNVNDPQINQKIWEQYVRAFKNGVFNLIREEPDPRTNELLSRKYVSGGFNLRLDAAMKTTVDAAMLPDDKDGKTSVVQTRVDVVSTDDDADWARANDEMVGRPETTPAAVPGTTYAGRYDTFVDWLGTDSALPISQMGPSALIDVGSSRGDATLDLAKAIAGLNPQMRVYGVDTRSYDRTALADRLPDNLEFLQDDHKLENSVVNERIRVITIFNVLRHYYPDQKRGLIEEAAARLGNGDYLIVGEGGPLDRPDKLGFIVFRKISDELVPERLVINKANVEETWRSSSYLTSWTDLMTPGQRQIWKPFLDGGLRPGNYKELANGLISIPLQQRSAMVAFMKRQWSKVRGNVSDNAQKGGIDLTPQVMALKTTGNGEEIRFNLDPQQLARFKDIPGLTSVILNIQPMRDLNLFMGLKDQVPPSAAANL